jgi:hypothetical protein
MSSDLDRIDAAIVKVEGQIDACPDPEERKLLRKKEEQLREERLILLRKTEGNVTNMCNSFHPAKLLSCSLGWDFCDGTILPAFFHSCGSCSGFLR